MKNLINKKEMDRIDSICAKYKIKNYSINSDGSIDVDGDVIMRDEFLDKLPLRFNIVSGGFDCGNQKITTLDGSPNSVGGNFICSDNLLTSLVGGPNFVGGNFSAIYNDLSNLEGCPTTVNGNFQCFQNHISSTYSGDTDLEVGGSITINIPFQQLLHKLLLDNLEHIKLILKFQRHFYIWNDDLSLNEENFQDLLDEINEGLE